MVLRAKVFSRIQTGEDHEIFVDGLLCKFCFLPFSRFQTWQANNLSSISDEMALRKRISELQEYRRNGVTSIAEGERYDHAKTQRVSTFLSL